MTKSQLEDLAFEYLRAVKLSTKISIKAYQDWAKSLKSKSYSKKEAEKQIMKLARKSKLMHKIGKKNHQKFVEKHFSKDKKTAKVKKNKRK